jgi:MerR family redox-sensitive transcriptional activator SoxR
MSRVLTIGEIARRSGVASSALRFYEQRGLITSERAGSGHRRYPRAVLRRIAFIVFAQRIGLTLEEIGAELAKLPPIMLPPGRIGLVSRLHGARGLTSASPSWSA